MTLCVKCSIALNVASSSVDVGCVVGDEKEAATTLSTVVGQWLKFRNFADVIILLIVLVLTMLISIICILFGKQEKNRFLMKEMSPEALSSWMCLKNSEGGSFSRMFIAWD